MPNIRYTKRKRGNPVNPFKGKTSVHHDHPAIWVLNLILAKVDRQIEEKEWSTYPRTSPAPDDKPVLENVPESVEVDQRARIAKLKEKVKVNIDNCRKTMVKTKQTLSFRDSRGNLPTGRGGGKFGQKRLKTKTPEVEVPMGQVEGDVGTPSGTEQVSGEEQQLVENRPEAQEDAEAERATLNELEVSTEDELPKEEEPQGEVRTSVLVANAFRQLSSVAGRYDRYNTRNRVRLVEEGEAEEEQISARVGPPTRSASKEKAPGKGDQTPTKKKNESPTKGKETSSKGRQAQLVQGFQHMVQTLMKTKGNRRRIDGSSDRGNGRGTGGRRGQCTLVWRKPPRGPGEGRHSTERKGKWSGHQNLGNPYKIPQGTKEERR